MKVTVEKIDDINIILSGNIDTKLIEERFTQLKLQKAGEATDEKLQEEVESAILQEFIDAGIKEGNIAVANILGQPGFRKYEKQGDSIYYEVAISTNPEINTNINYKDLIPTFTAPSVDVKHVANQLIQIAKQRAPFTPLAQQRAVINGDVVLIDFEGFLGNEKFEGGSAENFKLKIGSNAFLDGFEEQLIGMSAKEQRDVLISFPDDYPSEDLAGKKAKFIVSLHEVQEQIAMTINDDFAKIILDDKNATLASLTDTLTKQMHAQALSDFYRNELKPILLKGLLGKFEFTLPQNIIEQEIDTKVHALLAQMDEEEKEVQKNNKEKFQALRDSVKQEAKDSIKTALLVEALAEKENVEVTEEEVVAALKYQAAMTGQNEDELVNYHKDNNLMTSVKTRLIEDKLFRALLKI